VKPLLVTLALLGLSFPAPSQQTNRFLRADRWEMLVGESVHVRFQDLGPGEPRNVPWPGRFDWFFVRAGGGQENLFDPRTSAGKDALELMVDRPGITMIGADCAGRIERVGAAELRLFLRTRIGPKTLAEGWEKALVGDALRVRRIESAKVLVRVLGKEGFLPNSATAQSKTGQAVEIRPLADPASVPVKSDLPLRIYVPNPAKAWTKVIARHIATARTQTFLTDSFGSGFFTITVAGVWAVEAHHARVAPDEAADWEIYSATLTFEVPPGDPRQGGGGK
jgi:hypothetical protein